MAATASWKAGIYSTTRPSAGVTRPHSAAPHESGELAGRQPDARWTTSREYGSRSEVAQKSSCPGHWRLDAGCRASSRLKGARWRPLDAR